ncbi:MAG: type II toxin-antitoxin system HicA family toxin [Candidatus Tectomicrobia bacterium]|uniref:Type II toxin-antitoxin system HicA family toxin n=1 Tax=Tectimicrobiota bacterium TaxID=2528274 RepID=A0A932I0T9_UNCTE|nr:type II toxin-antitoxin system HicA family toxin [Candidatus Tectomicrobia bacterium]
MNPHPIKFRELERILRDLGILSLADRGKGSHVVFLRPEKEGSRKGVTYPVKHHGDNSDVSVHVVQSIIRAFGLSPKDFWGS